MRLPSYFEQLCEFRVKGRCLYELGDILGLILRGCLADCSDCSEIVNYGEDNIDFSKQT